MSEQAQGDLLQKTEISKLQKGQNYLESMQETHRWSHTSSSKIWENW